MHNEVSNTIVLTLLLDSHTNELCSKPSYTWPVFVQQLNTYLTVFASVENCLRCWLLYRIVHTIHKLLLELWRRSNIALVKID